MFKGLVGVRQWGCLPNLIATLVGDNHDEKSNRSIGSELAVEALSRGRDNPRTLLSCQPGLVAFVTSHCSPPAPLRIDGPKGTGRHARPCKVRACSRLLLCDRPFLFWLGEKG